MTSQGREGQTHSPVEGGSCLSCTRHATPPARAARRAHPLYADVALSLLAEVVNSRLFTTVRDALGLTYDVSFELSLFDRLRAGWYCVKARAMKGRRGHGAWFGRAARRGPCYRAGLGRPPPARPRS